MRAVVLDMEPVPPGDHLARLSRLRRQADVVQEEFTGVVPHVEIEIGRAPQVDVPQGKVFRVGGQKRVDVALPDLRHRGQEAASALHHHVQPVVDHVAARGEMQPVKMFFRVHHVDVTEKHMQPCFVDHRQAEIRVGGGTPVPGDPERVPRADERRAGGVVRLQEFRHRVRRPP